MFMINKILFSLTLVGYSIVVSQAFMYMLSLKTMQMALDGSAYTQVRQLIDASMNVNFRYVMYITLVLNLLYVIANAKAPSSAVFITATISLVALVIDGILSLKGSVPINQIIDSWSPAALPADWKEVRLSWFRVFQWRQAIDIVGFLSLLAGTIVGGK